MQRQPVKSSNVKAVGYDEFKQILEVEFVTGDIYQYMEVPENVYISLMTAHSIGKAIHELIKGKFKFEKVGA